MVHILEQQHSVQQPESPCTGGNASQTLGKRHASPANKTNVAGKDKAHVYGDLGSSYGGKSASTPLASRSARNAATAGLAKRDGTNTHQ